MNQLLTDIKYFLFYPKFSFFDFWSMWMITTFAVAYSWWLFLLMIPALVFSVAMEWRVKLKQEAENAKISNGKIG